MNGNDILRAMNGLDNRFVISANRERAVKHSKNKRIAARFAIGIAAAIVFAIPASAVYTQFIHKAAVQEYFADDTADYLENNGLALNYVSENEHLRLTVDTLLSDGHIGSMILTIEGLDEVGIECVQSSSFPEIYLSDVQTGDYIPLHENGSPELTGGGSKNFDACTDTQITIQRELLLDEIDIDKDYILTFGMSSEHDAERDENHVLTDNVMEGLSMQANFRPNVDVKEFESENGESLWVSQLGFYTNEEDIVSKMVHLSSSDRNIALDRKNSIMSDEIETTAETYDNSPERTQPIGCGWFHSIVDITEYNGAEIGDMEFG